jgi:hypothetical protein
VYNTNVEMFRLHKGPYQSEEIKSPTYHIDRAAVAVKSEGRSEEEVM